MMRKLRSFIVNIICATIYNDNKRAKLRAILNSDFIEYLIFIKRDIKCPINKAKFFTGSRGRNLIIAINDKYIYKFPLRHRDGVQTSIREQRITNALRDVSPISIPKTTILKYKNLSVRKYPMIHGATINQIPTDTLIKNKEKIAKQIAEFLYAVGRADPDEIRDLKPAPGEVPSHMYGWNQGDIYENFFINPKTMKIVAFIDWEDCFFGDFSKFFSPIKNPHANIIIPLVREYYDKLYYKKSK